MDSPPTVRLRTRAYGISIYRRMVGRADPSARAGDVVRVEERGGRFVAYALYSPRSEIALRVLTRKEGATVDDDWFRETVRRAAALRRDTLALGRFGDAWRVVNSEADSLPGLIVDRYANVLSCSVASLGMYRRFAVLRDALKAETGARVVHVQADPRVAKREGFPVPDSAGDAARATIREHGLQFGVDCSRGHKTGFFLDQRDSRLRIRQLAEGRAVLDLFSYTAGFALNAARGGAKRVVSVDLDEDAVAQGRRNAERNDLAKAIEFRHADAFDVLRESRTGEFDMIVVDPAKQAMRREDIGRALRYYEDVNALAFEKVARGGLVLSCSCTGLVGEGDFLETLARAGTRARTELTFMEIRGAPSDHPVSSEHPAGRYLKCVLSRVG